MSVFTFASAIARVLAGFDTTTRPARLANSVAIAHVLPVTSKATSSVGARLSAKARTCSGVVANRPACLTTPSCQIATCAKSRCTSSPIHRLGLFRFAIAVLLPLERQYGHSAIPIGSGWAKRQLRIRARSATGQVAGAATYYG